MAVVGPREAIQERLASLVTRGKGLEEEGLPFPTEALRESIEMALAEGNLDRAGTILKQSEALYQKATRDWMWVRELLGRADELRSLAERVGMDLSPLESRVGSPREQLRESTLSAGSLERAAASASLALAILNDALPKYCVQEAQKLGASIRRARDRGEEVGEATDEFRRLLRSLQEEQLPIVTQRLLDARRSVGRIPSAPSVGPLPTNEEEEILLEARALARRLHRIKGKAKNAQSAARLATQVRAALSEDRRAGSPEEDIEELWSEVDRVSRERTGAGGASASEESSPATPAAPSTPEPSRERPGLTPSHPSPSGGTRRRRREPSA